MTDQYQLLLVYLLLFLMVGIGFIFVHLIAGKFLRPAKPESEKLTIYECGEPTIGSSWIQFDLRFYVVALLFVIFDVEVAFFFPWAMVFGKANSLARDDLKPAERVRLIRELDPPTTDLKAKQLDTYKQELEQELANPPDPESMEAWRRYHDRYSWRSLAWVAFWDILIFFGVLLVGFAYLWKRGDLDWVRSVAAEKMAELGAEPSPTEREETLVGVGKE